MIPFVLFSLFASAGMSEIDWEVRTLIAEELETTPAEVHSLTFLEAHKDCLFSVQGQALDSTCVVCFQKKSPHRDPEATSIQCFK